MMLKNRRINPENLEELLPRNGYKQFVESIPENALHLASKIRNFKFAENI